MLAYMIEHTHLVEFLLHLGYPLKILWILEASR